MRDLAADEGTRARAERVCAAANRCAHIVKTFLPLARQKPQNEAAVDVNAVLAATIEMLGYQLQTSDIEVIRDLRRTCRGDKERTRAMTIYGSSSSEHKDGTNSADLIYVFQGNDTLVGNAGGDTLWGGSGGDVFDYNYVTDSPYNGVGDVIKDFQSGVDKIDLSAFSVSYDSNGGTVGPWQVGIGHNSAGTYWVWVNTDGDSAIEMKITLDNISNLSASDFLLSPGTSACRPDRGGGDGMRQALLPSPPPAAASARPAAATIVN